MRPLLVSSFLRLLACSAASYLLWRVLGPIGIVVAAPLFGVAFARPVIELMDESGRAARQLALLDLEGRHFEHRGLSMDITQDDHHHRWLSVTDVRKVIKGLPREAVLLKQFAQGLKVDEASGEWRIEAEVLLAYLSKATSTDSIKFRNWLERSVVFPAARSRQRLGIHGESSSLQSDTHEPQ